MNQTASELLKRIESKSAVVGIVGLGYVGLPLSKALLEAGYPVIGYDIDQRKIDAIHSGTSYIHHLGQEFFDRLKTDPTFTATTDPKALAKADAILLCVPTPLGHHREPDLTYVLDSTRMVAGILRKGQLIVLESTTYPSSATRTTSSPTAPNARTREASVAAPRRFPSSSAARTT
ncbi:MAG: hypothetical protein RLZZ217_1842 [Planctomycetota bacterium]